MWQRDRKADAGDLQGAQQRVQGIYPARPLLPLRPQDVLQVRQNLQLWQEVKSVAVSE